MILSWLVVFICYWWLVLYMVLPFGNTTAKKIQSGLADSAPEKPRLLLKFIITTLITIALTYATVHNINNGNFVKIIDKLY